MDYPKTVPGVSLLNGKFTDGDEINNVPASLDPASWANSLTDELLNIVRAASITPDEKKYDQVLKAIQKLIADATSGLTSGFSSVAAYTSNFKWPVPAGVTRVLVIAIGGGGGGSGGRGLINTVNTGGPSYIAGGGGGGGGVAIKFINTLIPGGSVPITVGIGGDGALYNATSHSNGNTGGSTSFGPYVTARGGLGAQNQIGGEGGSIYGANIGWNLGSGGIADVNSGGSMKGGFGGGGMRANGSSKSTGTSGVDGRNGFGMGGSGASSGYGSASPTSLSVRGGNGGSGRIMILY